MKVENKTKSPALKLNEGTLQGGFKSLDDIQKGKIKAGKNYRRCANGICW